MFWFFLYFVYWYVWHWESLNFWFHGLYWKIFIGIAHTWYPLWTTESVLSLTVLNLYGIYILFLIKNLFIKFCVKNKNKFSVVSIILFYYVLTLLLIWFFNVFFYLPVLDLNSDYTLWSLFFIIVFFIFYFLSALSKFFFFEKSVLSIFLKKNA